MLKLPVTVVVQAGMNLLPGKLLGILLGIFLVTVRIPAIKKEYYIPIYPNNIPTSKQPSCILLMYFTAIGLCSILENNSHCKSMDVPVGVVAFPSELCFLDIILQLPHADPTQYIVVRNCSHMSMQTYTCMSSLGLPHLYLAVKK